jgi:hypothetical protein
LLLLLLQQISSADRDSNLCLSLGAIPCLIGSESL